MRLGAIPDLLMLLNIRTDVVVDGPKERPTQLIVPLGVKAGGGCESRV